ncbi:Alpha-galactosidase 2 [Hibiscus syriacus]|uniref:Alpha-galactosidase 2 n=1 Tax=Hibiscus syriacus TaxID=106335 RepID=A0A6A2ZCP0_HIBSY|nr:TIR-only protein-like [Hibiscus syriacus]KAE8689507.1 Alpha-galactosidase 2 [Hibiscus syriacus]
MQQSCSSSAKYLCRKLVQVPPPTPNKAATTMTRPVCDIFINHRGIDTKRTIAGLLHDHLFRLGLRPFLDSRSMKPGDGLFGKINPAIRSCKLGVAIFSPNYCDSYFCMQELALLMENKKRVIPIFCDVKPSQLQVMDYGIRSAKQLERFNFALEDAKYTIGLAFDTLRGNWPEFLNSATEAVIGNLVELEAQNTSKKRTYILHGRE